MTVLTINVVDTETTGRATEPEAVLLEIAIAQLQHVGGRWRMGDGCVWETLVRHTGPIPPRARAVHHISPEMVAHAPPLPEVQEEMATWGSCRDGLDTLVHAAHHAEFDRHFLPWIGGRWIDTCQCAIHLWPDADGHGNQVLRYWLGLDPPVPANSAPHRALYDAVTTACILQKMLETHSVDDLVRLSGEAALLHRMNFGKHEGQLWSEAPPSYLRWVRDAPDMDRNRVHTARHWLQNQGGAR